MVGVSSPTPVPASSSGDSASVRTRMEGWPECFQDLRSWCPPDQDELNTPQITLQDEFNFSIDGQVNCNWGYVQSPGENDVWVNQDLLVSPNNLMFAEEENNNNMDISNSFSLPFIKTDLSESFSKGADFGGVVIGTPSSSALKTKGTVLLSQASLPQREDSQSGGKARAQAAGFSADYIKLNSSQLARLGSGGKLVKAEEVPEVSEATCLSEVTSRRVSQASRPSGLKLHIPQPPQASNESSNGSLTTPEVLKPLNDPSSKFDLLNYVFGASDITSRTPSIPKKESIVVAVTDHDYTDSKVTSSDKIIIKCEPLSPSPKKRPFLPDEEDFDSDGSCLLDDSESEEWSPSGKQARRASTSSGLPRKRGRKPSSIDSSDGTDKYRALRDRNNEASRRSRLNRKQKDLEMRRLKSDLEKRNIELKVKADRMEALVKDMRAVLLKSITNSRCNSS